MKISPLLTAMAFALLFTACCAESPAESTNPRCLKRPALRLGDTVPDVSLRAWHNKKLTTVNPKNYRGRWLVLFFYPGDFTFVCPTELKELADYYNEIRSMGGEVISISTDSEYVHRAWHRQDKRISAITYPMASDRNGALSRALGIYNDKGGSSERGTFIIDPRGVITAFEVHHESIGRSGDELLRKLSAAIAVSKDGGYCPAGWKQGDKMIQGEQ